MKKSTTIHLILVSAVLASCNRGIIPAQPAPGYTADSILMTAPACDDSTGNYLPSPYYSYDFYYNWQPFGWYYPQQIYRKGAFWRNHRFILRGGFGKRASASS